MASGLSNIGQDDAFELANLLQVAQGMTGWAPADYSLVGLMVLSVLLAAGRRGLNQIQLATEVRMTPAAMSRLIDQLERDSFIARLGHPNDRRSKVIQLTPAGRERALASEAERQQRCQRAFEGLSRDDVTRLKAILSRVVSNLGAESDTGASAGRMPPSGRMLRHRNPMMA